MCSPSLVVGAISLGLAVSGQQKQAQADREAASENAKILKTNQRLANLAADDEIEIGKAEEKSFELQLKQFASNQVAVMGASGVVVGEGSFADIESDTARGGKVDSLTIRSNSLKRATDIRTQATAFGSLAERQKRLADLRSQAGDLRTTGTLLTGGASLFSRFQSRGA